MEIAHDFVLVRKVRDKCEHSNEIDLQAELSAESAIDRRGREGN